MDKTPLELAYSVLVLDLAVSKSLWDWQNIVVDGRERLVIVTTDLFTEWKTVLRGKYGFKREVLPPDSVPHGEIEYQRMLKAWSRFRERHTSSSAPAPQGVKRWRIIFDNEIDPLMFKLRWIG